MALRSMFASLSSLFGMLRNGFVEGKATFFSRKKFWPVFIISTCSFRLAKMIDDKDLQNLNKQLASELKGSKVHEFKTDMKGNRYQISFEFQNYQTDIMQIFLKFLATYKNIKVSNFEHMYNDRQEDIFMTVQVHFQSKSDKGLEKGMLSLSGKPGSRIKVMFEKYDRISMTDIEALKALLTCITMRRKVGAFGFPLKQRSQVDSESETGVVNALKDKGVTVYMPQETKMNLAFENLGGYQTQKKEIEDAIFLSLKNPEVFENIMKKTRKKVETNRPRAILLEGPPGTGKTTTAKIVASQVDIPLIYVPLESVLSKWYAESEQNLAEIWQLSKKLGKAIIFFDEIDALAFNRQSSHHEVTGRVISVLLRKLDGFDSSSDVLLVAATNRKSSLDPAILSRMDISLKFDLPDLPERQAIIRLYAKQLTEDQTAKLAELTAGYSGRRISDLCKHVERRWGSRIIRGEVSGNTPDYQAYQEVAKEQASQ